jgi:uncharacterized lipoprotein YbaY
MKKLLCGFVLLAGLTLLGCSNDSADQAAPVKGEMPNQAETPQNMVSPEERAKAQSTAGGATGGSEGS